MKKASAAVSQVLFQVLIAIAVPLVLGVCVYLVFQRMTDSGQVEKFAAETRANTETIARQAKSLDDHGRRLDAAERAILAHDGRIGAAEKELGQHGERLGRAEKDIADTKHEAAKEAGAIRTRIEALEKDLAQAREDRTKDQTRVEALERQIAALREEMKKLSESLDKRLELLEKLAAEKKASQ
jgi:septal ring factor EnvC (AmiA/AmiB activator)